MQSFPLARIALAVGACALMSACGGGGGGGALGLA